LGDQGGFLNVDPGMAPAESAPPGPAPVQATDGSEAIQWSAKELEIKTIFCRGRVNLRRGAEYAGSRFVELPLITAEENPALILPDALTGVQNIFKAIGKGQLP